jgi:hypothetical protein
MEKKVSISIKRLLFEAYRRNKMEELHERSKPLEQRWLGLGTKSAYKSVLDAGLMTWFNGRTPPIRCMGWLVLTPKGIVLFKQLEKEFEAHYKRMVDSGYYSNSIRANFTLAGGMKA